MEKIEVAHWFDDGLVDPNKPIYMIVIYEKYNKEFYPVYIYEGDNLEEKMEKYESDDMKEVIKIYFLTQDKESQF